MAKRKRPRRPGIRDEIGRTPGFDDEEVADSSSAKGGNIQTPADIHPDVLAAIQQERKEVQEERKGPKERKRRSDP